MRISMLGSLPPTKGVSPYCLGLVSGVTKNYEVDFYGFKSIYPKFLYPAGKTETNEKQPKMKNLAIKNYLTWYNPFSWLKVGFGVDSKVLHAQWWSWFLAPIYLTVMSIAKLRGKRTVLTVHNVSPHERAFWKKWLNSSVISLAAEYIVHSEHNKKVFAKKLGNHKKINVFPHGTIEMAQPKESRDKLRKKYGFKKGDNVLLFFGVIRDYKGLDNLLKALSKTPKSFKLVVAGNPWGGFEKYDKMIKKLKLKDRVHLFLGYNPDKKVAELFKSSDLFVLPYKQFEAASGAGTVGINFGRAMVVTKVGSLPELVKDKKVVATPKNSDDLAKKIIYAIKNKKKLEKESVEKAREFAWDTIAKKMKLRGVYGG
ncbi:MAG: glycosyltransferase family 4 protein [Nanoarchaeota archaeon]